MPPTMTRRPGATAPRRCATPWWPSPCCMRLSPEHRAVLVHIYLFDRTIQETAGILGVPTGTVKSRQHNALRKLRTALPLDEAA